MIRTFNRAPVNVDTPNQSQIKQYFFNQQNWKGVVDNKNFLTVDQESFADSNNVYVNEEGLLKSRPSLKLLKSNVLDVWTFSNATIYLYDSNTLEIVVENISYTYTLSTIDIKIIPFETKLLIFSANDLIAFDLDKLEYQIVDKLIHIPITKSLAENSESSVMDKNELSDSEIYAYLFQIVKEDELFSSKVNTKLYGKTVYLENDDEKWYFVFNRVSENIITETHNLENIDISSEQNIRLTYSNNSTAVLFDRAKQKLYYSIDGRNFTEITTSDIPENTQLVDASISKDGYRIAVLTSTQAYVKNMTTVDGVVAGWKSLLSTDVGDPQKPAKFYNYDGLSVHPLNDRKTFSNGDLITMYDSDCFAILQTVPSYIYRTSTDTQLSHTFDCTFLLYYKDGISSYFALNFASYLYSDILNCYTIVNTDTSASSFVYSFAELDIIPSIENGPVCAILLNSFVNGGVELSELYTTDKLNNNPMCSAIIIGKSPDEVVLDAPFNFNRCSQRQNDLQIFVFNGASHLYSDGAISGIFSFRYRLTSCFVDSRLSYGRYCKILNGNCYFAANYFLSLTHGFKVVVYDNQYSKEREYSKATEYVHQATPLSLSSDMILYTGSGLYDISNLETLYSYPYNEIFSTLTEWNNKIVFTRYDDENSKVIVRTNALSSVKTVYEEVNFASQSKAKYTYFLPNTYADNTKLYLSKKNKLYISYPSDDNKLYFPAIQTNSFNDEITGLHALSSKETAIFFENAVYYAVYDTNTTIRGYDGVFRYYKTKLSTGLKKGCESITTFDGKYVIFPTYRGLAAMTYQDFVATEEQTVTYLSDNIYSKFENFISSDANVRLFKYSFWIIVYKLNSSNLLLLDTRNMSWWPFTYFGNVTKCVGIDKPEFLINNSLYKFDKSCNNYFDLTDSKISWFIKSQKLHLNAVNYYKHVSNMTFTSVHNNEELGNVQTSNFKLQVTNYRKQVYSTANMDDYITVNYDVNSAKTHILRLNYSKVNEFQYVLSSNDSNAINIPLSLSSIIVKYKVSNQMR